MKLSELNTNEDQLPAGLSKHQKADWPNLNAKQRNALLHDLVIAQAKDNTETFNALSKDTSNVLGKLAPPREGGGMRKGERTDTK